MSNIYPDNSQSIGRTPLVRLNRIIGNPNVTVLAKIDGRNPADIQMYVNGALVLTAEVFKLDAATGPLKLLAHIEKTADDETADYRINYLRVRTMDL